MPRRRRASPTLARDVSEFLHDLGLKPPVRGSDLVVAYHSACSLQHGQRITAQPKELLCAAGFTVQDIPEGHICCGSAGTYNLLQPELATRLRERKLGNSPGFALTWSRPATSAAWCSWRMAWRPWCTRWSCWIGRPAGRARACGPQRRLMPGLPPPSETALKDLRTSIDFC